MKFTALFIKTNCLNSNYKERAASGKLIAYITAPKRMVFLAISFVLIVGLIMETMSTKNVYAATGINQTINFQGKVVNKNGTNVADGQYTFVFKIYDAPSGGANPWTETQNNVQVTGGIFRVSLGSTTPITGVDFNSDNIYLAINFNSDGEMTPRVRFATVPYAFNAQKVAGLTVTDSTGTLTIPNSKTVQFGGAFTTSAQDLTLTLTGGTNVTLPTTGTLATLGGTENLSNKSFTTTVTFSGVTTDITTGTNEDFSVAPNGTGKVNINTTSGAGSFNVRPNAVTGGTLSIASISGSTAFAALLVDNNGSGDILTASSSGTTQLVLTNNGALGLGLGNGARPTAKLDVNGIASISSQLSFRNGAGAIQTTANNTLTIGGATTGFIVLDSSSGQVSILDNTSITGTLTGLTGLTMTSGAITLGGSTGTGLCLVGGASASWGTCGSASTFQQSLGSIFQINTTMDFLAGSQSSSSAAFKVTGQGNPFAGTQVGASVSANTSNTGLLVDNRGVGDILTASSAGVQQLVLTNNGSLGLGLPQGQRPTAKLDVNGMASVASQLSFRSGAGAIQTTGNNTLTIGGTTTGDIQFRPGNANSLYLASTGGVAFNGSYGSNQNCLISTGPTSAPIWGNCATGAGAWWNLNSQQGTTYSINTTVDALFGGTSTASAGFRIAGATKDYGTVAAASVSANTSYAGFVIDNRGSGDLITASSSGLTRFTVFQNGNVTIGNTGNQGYRLDVQGSVRIGNNTATDDISKQTTADWTVSGSSISTNDGVNTVTTTNNQLKLVTDLIGAGATLTAPAADQNTGTNVTTGSVAFQRPDKKFVVFVGGAATSRIYDPSTGLWGSGPSTAGGVSLGAGSRAFQRQNGSVIILHGGATSTTLYQHAASANFGTAIAGPATTGTVGAGSQIIRRTDGKVLVIHGNTSTTTSVYDPVAQAAAGLLGSFGTGPATTGNVVAGSFLIPRPDGKWILGLGNGTTTNVYDPQTTAAGGGSFSAGPALTTGTPGNGTHVIQLPDGRFMVLIGGSSNTQIYDPAAGTFSAGSTLAVDTLGAGAHSFQRSDGKWIVVVGGNSKNLQLFDPTNGANGTFSQLTGANGLQGGTNAGTGSLTFQRPDGKYIVVMGQTSQLTTIYDAGWNTTGTWTSEDINNTKISTYSAMMWSANPQSANNNARLDQETINFAVKTGDTTTTLSNNSYRSLQDSGDLIRAYGNSQYAKMQVTFTTPIRSYPTGVTGYISQTNIWEGDGGLFYRRGFIQPTVYSIRIQNPLVSYGDPTGQGDPAFGRNFATGSATLEGVATDNSNRLSLLTLRNQPIGTPSAGFIIASASANLGGNAGAGAHTLERNNGQFITILGGGTTTTRVYDADSNIWSAGPTLPNNAGAGAHSFLMPDGRFFVVLGNTTNRTAIFDPQSNVFLSGPNLIGNVGIGANSFQRPDGMFVILNGGATNLTNILDPYTMAVTQGPFTTGATPNVGGGAMNIKRPDGRILVILGNNNAAATGSNIYDPATNAFIAGPTVTTAITTGASGIQLSNGRVIIARGGNGTVVWDPITTSTAAGPAITANGAGSFWIPRADGKALLATGNNTATTQVYDQTGNTVTATTASPTLPCAVNTGGHVFQRQTGEYVVICGGSSANTAIIDAGWNLGGTYTTEQSFLPYMNGTTSMYWKNVGQGSITVKYRTASTRNALGVASWKDMQRSGSYVTPSSGDVWFQARFDLQGSLQDLPGAKTRVWLASDSGGAMVYYRTVQAPTLEYWKLMNVTDPSLLTLTSGGDNAFRFSADGQAYTSNNGAWNSGGADLAERYTSKDSLTAGEVVSLDRINPQNTKRSTIAYDQNSMGVVSTQPGFVAGAFTENSYPVALVGRVPVKVSNENGEIHAGDYLTSASIPGYAMKATVAGRVLGQAMEPFDPAQGNETFDCPKFAAGNLETTRCGSVTVFVNLTSYNGQSIDVAVKQSGLVLQKQDLPLIAGIDFDKDIDKKRQQEVLNFLRNQKDNGQSLYTDRVAATQEVISPQIITDLLVAKKIKAESIEGLEILTNSIDTLSDKVATASSVEGFTRRLTNAEEGQKQLVQSMASLSAKLAKMGSIDILKNGIKNSDGDLTTVENLAVFGTTTLSEVSITTSVTIGTGNTLSISSNSINTIGSDLEIQPLKQGGITFLGGLIAFSLDGKVKFSEDVSFEKNVDVAGIMTAKTVSTVDLQLGQGKTTVISDTEVDASGAAGLVVLKQNTSFIKVRNPLVHETSFIFITPKTATRKSLYLLEQKEAVSDEPAYFKVGIDSESSEDIKFNYLIVN